MSCTSVMSSPSFISSVGMNQSSNHHQAGSSANHGHPSTSNHNNPHILSNAQIARDNRKRLHFLGKLPKRSTLSSADASSTSVDRPRLDTLDLDVRSSEMGECLEHESLLGDGADWMPSSRRWLRTRPMPCDTNVIQTDNVAVLLNNVTPNTDNNNVPPVAPPPLPAAVTSLAVSVASHHATVCGTVSNESGADLTAPQLTAAEYCVNNGRFCWLTWSSLVVVCEKV